jgi:glycosyltransferase involved in cell wall biosynthesis
MATITTIIPTYQRPRLLRGCIRSILAQSYPDFEVHVYDNASGDETPEVVAQFAARDPRVKCHVHPRNIGMMENFAYGIAQVDTPYFNILSDDDFLLPGFFDAAIDNLTADPEPGFFFGGLLFFDGAKAVAAPVEAWNIEGRVEPSTIFRALFPGNWITWTSSLFRTAAVAAAGGLKPELGYGADVELLLRLAVRNAAIVSRKPCGVMNLHHGSASAADGGQQYSAARILTIFESVENAVELALREGSITQAQARSLRTIIRNGIEWRLFRRAFVQLAQGHRESALETAEVLRRRCGSARLAAIVRVAASTNSVGRLTCAGLRSIRRVRGRLRRHAPTDRYREYETLIERVRNDLEPEPSEALGRTMRIAAGGS